MSFFAAHSAPLDRAVNGDQRRCRCFRCLTDAAFVANRFRVAMIRRQRAA